MKLFKLSSYFALSEALVNVCYYTNWSQYRPGLGKFLPENTDPFLCTHINYAFGFVNEDGTGIKPFEWNDILDYTDGMYKKVTDLKKINPKLKVLLSIGGWTHGTGAFTKAARNSDSRQTFAENSLAYIKEHNFDGIDVDWEYPGFRDHPTKPGTFPDVENHVKLLEKLKEVFKIDGKMVTAAVGAAPSRVQESYPATQRICDALDLIHIMTYDFHGGWEKTIDHHSPFVTDGKNSENSDPNWAVKPSINYWVSQGCQAEKMTLGLGSYGRGWKAQQKTERLAPGDAAGLRGQYTRESGFVAFYEVCDWSTHIDPATFGAVATNGQFWVGFETTESASIKTTYAVEKGLAGIMWWSLDMDDFDGKFCGMGIKYPLISTVWSEYLEKSGKPAPPTHSPTTKVINPTSGSAKLTSRPVSTEKATTSTLEDKSVSTSTPSYDSLESFCRSRGDGMWKSPKSCGYFVQCYGGGHFFQNFQCPSGTIWNSVSKVCDWETNVQSCEKCDCNENNKGTQIKTTASATPKISSTAIVSTGSVVTGQSLARFCKKRANGVYSHPKDCSRFIQCFNGRKFKKSCPSGLKFNKYSKVCDWPQNVQC